MEITLQTLTPLWTGGINGTTDRLHETGLIGSLRWWYEALVRGLGGYACDPTSDGRCEYDPKKKEPPEKQLCAACYLFGCTGWARKFRLQLSDGQVLFKGQNILIPSGRIHQSRHGPRAGGWFVFSESRQGKIALNFTSLQNADLEPLHTILALIGRHASLGPKGASGYGVIRLENGVPNLDWIQKFGSQTPSRTRNNTLPDFRDFFFARFQFNAPNKQDGWWQTIYGIQQAVNGKPAGDQSPPPLPQSKQELEKIYNQGILPIAPAIRNWLRYQWQHNLSPGEAHFVFGEAQAVCPNCYQPGFKPDRKDKRRNRCFHCKSNFDKGKEKPTTASKIYVSYAYLLDDSKWEFRIWGWLPCVGKLQDRDKFLNNFEMVLMGTDIWKFVFGQSNVVPQRVEWHALDCSQTDGLAYLNELLGGAQ